MSIGAIVGISVAAVVLFVILISAIIVYFVWRKSEVVCEKCGYVYRPKFFKVLFGWHVFDTYLLTCPKCGETCAHHLDCD